MTLILVPELKLYTVQVYSELHPSKFIVGEVYSVDEKKAKQLFRDFLIGFPVPVGRVKSVGGQHFGATLSDVGQFKRMLDQADIALARQILVTKFLRGE